MWKKREQVNLTKILSQGEFPMRYQNCRGPGERMCEMSKGLHVCVCVCVFDCVLIKRCLPSQATSLIIYQAL